MASRRGRPLALLVGGVAGLAAGCGQPAPGGPPVAPVSTAGPVATVPPVASLEPWVTRSAARGDWPCAIDVLVNDRSLYEVAVTYDGPTRCLLPVETQCDGIVGCPTRTVHTGMKSGVERVATFSYDVEDRLVEIAYPTGTTRYEWEGEVLVARRMDLAGREPARFAYRPAGDVVELVHEMEGEGVVAEFVLRFDGAQLVQQDIPRDRAVTKLTWGDGRLRTVEHLAPRHVQFDKLRYDCGDGVVELPSE